MRKLVSFIAALAMVATFAMSAAAADWNFYGSARIETFYESADVTGGNDTDNFSLNQAGNARIGANVAVSDELTGRFEYGSGPNLRLLYGEWNFGAGSLTVGQDYTPIALTSGYSLQFKNGNTGLIGYGMPYGGRVPQLKLTFGNFSIAAISNPDLEEGVQDDVAAAATTAAYTALFGPGVTAATATNAQRVAAEAAGAAYGANITAENTFPRMEFGYFYDVGPVKLRTTGGYATVEFEDNNPNQNWSDDFDAYLLGVSATFTSGPFYASAGYSMGENLSVLGVYTTTTALPDVDAAGRVTDAETDMYYALGGFRFNEMLAAEIGWGTEDTEIGAADQEVTSYYLTLPITLAPGVTVRPEAGVFDAEEVDGSETTYGGVTWQINF